MLVTYDIFENKKYSYLLKLIESMIVGESKVKSMSCNLLPIRTPVARYIQISEKMIDKQRKKKEKKLKEKKVKDKPVEMLFLQEHPSNAPLILENIDEYIELDNNQSSLQNLSKTHSKNEIVPIHPPNMPFSPKHKG
jgi:hypothetical protein